MKLSALLLLTALQLAVGRPQDGHDHEHTTTTQTPTVSGTEPSTTRTPTASGTEPATVPSPIGAAPSDCKAISTDSTWPTVSVWTAALPGIEAKHVEDVGRPDYFYTATNATGVQAAVKFAAANNLRLVVVNSGHDFLGRLAGYRCPSLFPNDLSLTQCRNDAPSGLSLDISKLTGVNVLTSFTPGTTGATSPSPSAAANVVKPVAGQQAAVTFGAGVSTQALNDAIAASGLFTLGAAHGELSHEPHVSLYFVVDRKQVVSRPPEDGDRLVVMHHSLASMVSAWTRFWSTRSSPRTANWSSPTPRRIPIFSGP